MTMLTETRERFLLAIAAKLPVERIAEIHFFQPIKQGGVESGVAVIAVWPERQLGEPAQLDVAPEEPAPVESAPAESDEATPDAQASEELSEAQPAEPQATEDPEPVEPATPEAPAPRSTIYTARYRLTLKGPDRGKWETHLVEEADAPLITVDVVVRGVQRRAGDVDDPTRMDGDEVRAYLAARDAQRDVQRSAAPTAS